MSEIGRRRDGFDRRGAADRERTGIGSRGRSGLAAVDRIEDARARSRIRDRNRLRRGVRTGARRNDWSNDGCLSAAVRYKCPIQDVLHSSVMAGARSEAYICSVPADCARNINGP